MAELKRYLPDPIHRIRLHDLLMQEVSHVVQQISDFRMDQPQPTPAAVAERLRAYERQPAMLMALLLHAGYYADRPEHYALLGRPLNKSRVLELRLGVGLGEARIEESWHDAARASLGRPDPPMW
ncbi:MAG: hypothetical protein M3O70_01185 [Actinomycetota bacterium]|nr:hypothetical protein [Actinomycetota bacterium]